MFERYHETFATGEIRITPSGSLGLVLNLLYQPQTVMSAKGVTGSTTTHALAPSFSKNRRGRHEFTATV
jgi:hypothetical protein